MLFEKLQQSQRAAACCLTLIWVGFSGVRWQVSTHTHVVPENMPFSIPLNFAGVSIYCKKSPFFCQK